VIITYIRLVLAPSIAMVIGKAIQSRVSCGSITELAHSSSGLRSLIATLLAIRKMLQHHPDRPVLAPALRIPTHHSLRPQERQTSILLLKPHQGERDHHSNPVKVVRKHRAIRGGVLPPEYSIENAPPATAIDLGIGPVDVPHAFADVVAAWPRADFGSVAANDLVPGVDLEAPHGFAEEACGDEIKEAGRDSEEELQLCCIAAAVVLSAMVYAKVAGQTHR